MLLRAKQVSFLTGYSDTQSRRFIEKIKALNKLVYEEPMIAIEYFCNYFSLDITRTEKKLSITK